MKAFTHDFTMSGNITCQPVLDFIDKKAAKKSKPPPRVPRPSAQRSSAAAAAQPGDAPEITSVEWHAMKKELHEVQSKLDHQRKRGDSKQQANRALSDKVRTLERSLERTMKREKLLRGKVDDLLKKVEMQEKTIATKPAKSARKPPKVAKTVPKRNASVEALAKASRKRKVAAKAPAKAMKNAAKAITAMTAIASVPARKSTSIESCG